MSFSKKLAAIVSVAALLVAVLFFPAASAVACGTVGGGAVPTFSLQAGGYGAQAIVQPQFVQQFAQPLYAQQFVQQPLFAQQYAQPLLQAGYGGVGAAIIVPQRVRQRVVIRHHH